MPAMLVSDPLFGVYLKLARARNQLKVLDGLIKTYFDAKPYAIEPQIDLEPPVLWKVIRIKTAADPLWSAITGEIIHNLRCALDYIVYQLVILNTGATPITSKNQFPIFKTEPGFNSRGVPTMLN